MSPKSAWTEYLESLHSALIDELVELLPEPKPELGMPLRQSEISAPSAEIRTILACETRLGESRGIALLAFDASCGETLPVNAESLWDAIFARAKTEFARRGIQPVVTGRVVLPSFAQLPSGYPLPSRIIWIPFRLGARGAVCYLGMGI